MPDAEPPIPAKRVSLLFPLVQLALMMLMGATASDNGGTMRIAIYAALAFWIGAVVILIRRRRQPTRGDIVYFRWAYLLLCLVTACVILLTR